VATWAEFERSEPAFAGRVAAAFGRRKHHVMATVRKGGAPRLSGTEVAISDGAFGFGVMAGAVRLVDLRRDPRVAFHSQGVDPPEHDHSTWDGEVKVAGRAVAVPAPADGPQGEHFVVDLDEVVCTGIGSPADHLVIERWTPTGGLQRIRRA
jgi:hypothetical protein